MPEEIAWPERSRGGWRVIASAWLVAVMFVTLFTVVPAVTSPHHRRKPPLPDITLVGAMIPRHDPSFLGPDEVKELDLVERARADDYTGW
jgi:hypothetical protein